MNAVKLFFQIHSYEWFTVPSFRRLPYFWLGLSVGVAFRTAASLKSSFATYLERAQISRSVQASHKVSVDGNVSGLLGWSDSQDLLLVMNSLKKSLEDL